jgi:hypothetical protein
MGATSILAGSEPWTTFTVLTATPVTQAVLNTLATTITITGTLVNDGSVALEEFDFINLNTNY